MAKRITIITTADLKNTASAPSTELLMAVAAANGNASTFTYGSHAIMELARRAEKRLDSMALPQVDRVGFEAQFSHAGPSAKAYKYSAKGSSVSMRRMAKGWVLLSINEIIVFPTQGERVSYRATEHQIAEAARRAVADLTKIAA